MIFNPLLNVDASSLSDTELEERIHKINKSLSAAYQSNSPSAVNQLRGLLNLYINEQMERIEIQSFKQYYETDEVTTLTLDDEPEEKLDENKPKVEEKEGGKLSLFRKVMNQQSDQK